MTKCKLEEAVYGVDEALSTCKHMLKLWKEVYEAVLEKSALCYILLTILYLVPTLCDGIRNMKLLSNTCFVFFSAVSKEGQAFWIE